MIFLIGILVAFGVSAFLQQKIIRLALEKNLVEKTNTRKTHPEKVAALGGIGIFAGLVITSLFFLPMENFWPILAGATVLFLTGLNDDLFSLRASVRLAIQILVAFMIVSQGWILTLPLGLPEWLNASVTVFFIVLMINAYNMIDGINGLSGGLSALAFALPGCWFLLLGQAELALFCFLVAGSVIGFLKYNFLNKAKIFMGDNGSTVLGFLLAIIVIHLGSFCGEEGSWLAVAIIPGLSGIAIFDVFSVVVIRLISGRSPFEADRNHIHHFLMEMGLTPVSASLILMGTQLSMFSLVFLPGNWLGTVLLISLGFLLAGFKFVFIQRRVKPALQLA